MTQTAGIVPRLARAGRELAGQADAPACVNRLVALVGELSLASSAAVLGVEGVERDQLVELPFVPWEQLCAESVAGDVIFCDGAWFGTAMRGPSVERGGWSAVLLLRDVTNETAVCALASHASTALTLAFERAHSQVREQQLFALVEAGKTLAREHNLEAVLQRIAELATSLLGAEKQGAEEVSADDEVLAMALASQAGIAIDSAELYEALTQSAEELDRHARDLASANDDLAHANEQLENANEQLENANEHLHVASQHKSSFLANMSHELRSPLNTIIGYTSLMIEEPESLTQEQFEDLKIIQKSSRHLLTMIADLLDLGKIEAGRLDLHLAPMDAGELLADTVASLQPQAKHGVQLAASGLDGLAIVADRGRMRQMLLNVLGNAIKFTETGVVDASLERHGDMAHFTVVDSGSGIPPADISRIFDSFFQSTAALARTPQQQEGAGLGLAITQALADRHGGTVLLESELGTGTTVTIKIPIAGPHSRTGVSEREDA